MKRGAIRTRCIDMNEIVGPINSVVVRGIRYTKDWNGEWFFVVHGGVSHVGQVLSEFVHPFYSDWNAKLFLESYGWTFCRGIMKSNKLHADTYPLEWQAAAYLCDEWDYVFIPGGELE